MTSEPADFFGIKGRGRLAAGLCRRHRDLRPGDDRLGEPRRAPLRPARRRQAHGDAVARRRLHDRQRPGRLRRRRGHRNRQRRSAPLVTPAPKIFSKKLWWRLVVCGRILVAQSPHAPASSQAFDDTTSGEFDLVDGQVFLHAAVVGLLEPIRASLCAPPALSTASARARRRRCGSAPHPSPRECPSAPYRCTASQASFGKTTV